MQRQMKNELRKKVEHYSYGLNDHLDLTKRTNIFRGINESTEEKVAIKVVDIRHKDTDPAIRDHLSIEIEAIKKVIHPNVIHVLDIYSTVNNCYIITQFCEGGDLENRVNCRGTLEQPQALTIFRDLLLGYMQITREKFIHGGLKLSSLLLKDKALRISGFSNCRKTTKPEIRREVAYNPYQSPQSVQENIFNHKSDIWSLGMILYVILHGQTPFPGGKNDLLEEKLRPIDLSMDLSEDVCSFIRQTLVFKEQRLSLQKLFQHRLVTKLLNGYVIADKYALNVQGQQLTERNKKQQHHLSKVEKHLNTQINWMRFLFRLMDRINVIHEESTTTVLKFIVLRQVVVHYENLRMQLETGQNVFNFSYWDEFLEDRTKLGKYREVLYRNHQRYDKAKAVFLKLMDKYTLKATIPKGMNQLINDNFPLSQYNSMFAISASLPQIKRLWMKIVKEYSPQGKYTAESLFKYKNELLTVDFLTTYYQLNCLLVDNYNSVDYFEKMSKLEIILDYNPSDLDGRHLEEMELKLQQLRLL